MRYVFVYGTLRMGEANDICKVAIHYGLDAPRFVGAGEVRGWLYDFGHYPGLVLDTSAGWVRGDVYEIGESLVPVLDEIEHVRPGVDGLFRSDEVRLALGGSELCCLFYPVAPESVAGRLRIESGNWVAYRLARCCD